MLTLTKLFVFFVIVGVGEFSVTLIAEDEAEYKDDLEHDKYSQTIIAAFDEHDTLNEKIQREYQNQIDELE